MNRLHDAHPSLDVAVQALENSRRVGWARAYEGERAAVFINEYVVCSVAGIAGPDEALRSIRLALEYLATGRSAAASVGGENLVRMTRQIAEQSILAIGTALAEPHWGMPDHEGSRR